MSDQEPLALLRPELPTADQLRPFLERIDAAGWYTNFGPLSQQLESELAKELAGSTSVHVATTSSGTMGLKLALDALRLPAGSRVLVPSLTFPATATAVRRAELVPVFGDVDPQSWALEVETARACQEQIDAVLPVAIFGRAIDGFAWDAFTADTGIPVVIDAAGAFGNQLPSATTAVVYSMHATKPLACGEGGFVASADPEFVRRIWIGSNFGFDGGLVQHVGTNAKLSEYHAAVALAALASWPDTRARRVNLESRFLEALHPLRGRVDMHAPSSAGRVRSVFVVRIPSGVDETMLAALAKEGIEARRWYHPPVHEHPAFAKAERVGDLATTRRLSRQLLGLPFHLALPEDAPARIAAALDAILPR